VENGGNRVVLVDLKYGEKTVHTLGGFNKSDWFDY
jgi:hypothetical protein